jgi:hypothetical protein
LTDESHYFLYFQMASLSTAVVLKIVTHSHKCKKPILWFIFSICSTLSNSHDHLLSHNRILTPEVHIIRSGRQLLTMETNRFSKRSKDGNAYIALLVTAKAEHISLPLMKKSRTYPCLLRMVFVALKRLKHDDQSCRKKTQVYRAEPAAMSRIQRAKT